MGKFALCSKEEEGYVVEGYAQGRFPEEARQGCIFYQAGQAVAKIEEGLGGVGVIQRATAEVVDGGGGLYTDGIAGALEAPAEIDLFLMGKKPRVKATDFMK